MTDGIITLDSLQIDVKEKGIFLLVSYTPLFIGKVQALNLCSQTTTTAFCLIARIVLKIGILLLCSSLSILQVYLRYVGMTTA